MNIGQAMDDFLLAIEADGRRVATIKWYRSVLTPLVNTGVERPLRSVTAREMREYIVALRGRSTRYIDAPQRPSTDGKLSNETIRGHVTALHSFWNWCAREYQIESPMKNIRRPPRQKSVPRAIEPTDFIKLMKATGDDAAGIRDRALLIFLADTGCRLGGLVSLRANWLFLDEKYAQLVEKGGEAHKVYFTKYTIAVMSSWLIARQSESEFVFTSVTSGEALTASGVHQILKRLKKRAGVVGRVNPHSFRHRFALEYRKQGGDISTLALFMGNSIEVVFDYYSIFDETEMVELRKQHDPMLNLIETTAGERNRAG